MIAELLLMLLLGSSPAQEGDNPRFEAASRQFKAGQKAAGLKSFHELCNEESAPAELWFDVVRFLLAERSWRECLPFATEAHARMPENVATHLALGACHLYLNQPDKAVLLFADSVRRFPKVAAVQYNYALSLGRNQNLSEAEQHYREALELDPENPLFLCTMGQHAVLLLKNAEAEKWLRKAATVDPPHPDARWRLGLVLCDMGRDDDARVEFLKALETARGPSRVEALFHFGVYQFDRGRHELALRRFDLALKNSPSHRLAHQYRARCLRALGRLDEARLAVETYRKIQRDEDQVNEDFLLGLLAEQLGLEGLSGAGDEDDGKDENESDGA